MTLPPPLAGGVRGSLLQAYERVRGFADRVARECAGQMVCGVTCDGCCRQVLRLRGVEAAYLLEGARELTGGAVSLVWKTLAGPSERCPLLQGGVCLVYDHRPALCRTHGLPMVRQEGGQTILHHCPKNFVDLDPTRLPPSLILDELRLATLMDALDGLYARETGWGGERVAVDEVLRAGLRP